MINVSKRLQEIAEGIKDPAARARIEALAGDFVRQEQAQDARVGAALKSVQELMTFRMDAVDARQRQMLAMLEDLQEKLLEIVAKEGTNGE